MYCVAKHCLVPFAALVVLSGCHPHPLVGDVTGLSVSDLVHKIQCEAADYVKSRHPARNAPQGIEALRAANKEIEKKTEALRERAAKLPPGTEADTLAQDLYAVKLKASQLVPVLIDLKEKLEANPSDEQLRARLRTLDLESAELKKQFDRVTEDERTLADLDRRSKALATAIKERDKAFASILKFERHLAAFQLLLEITEDNDATSTGSVKWPFALGSITLGWDAGDKKQRLSDRRVSVVLTFRELNELPCTTDAGDHARIPARYPITGEIGLAEVISQYMRVSESGAGRFEDGGKAYSDKIRFTTTINGKLKPSVDISRKVGQVVTAGADLSAARKDVHELTILLSAPVLTKSDRPPVPQEIIVKRMPTLETSILREPPAR